MDFKGRQSIEGAHPKEGSLLYQFVKIAAVFIIMVLAAYFLNQFYKHRFSGESLACSAIEETKNLVLSDGTVVFLNRGSTIHYPEKFKRNERAVELSGEAFFEVSENQRKPFIVTIGEDLALKVLGTSFNINSSGMDASVIVHVVSGRVALYKMGHEDSGIVLGKDEQGLYTNNHLIKSTTDDANFLSWKTGILTFSNTSVNEMAVQLSRHYRQPIRVLGSWAGSTRLTSTFQDQSLDDVLEEMQLILRIQYRYQNDTILIYK